MGPQGAGKGTQAQRIAEEYGVPHVATGDLYREHIANETELGKLVAPYLRDGKLVPDEVTIPIVKSEIIERGENGFVLDGYPRNLAQAEALDDLLDEIGRPLSIILLLELSDATARERLAKRAALEGRADDQPDAIDQRLRDYHEKTEPVVDHYLATGKLVKMHAERPIAEVWTEVEDALEQVQARA